ncbi:MAG: endonuclease domain-containing protein [Alphaproteobacteria bacterium]|nr:MAG: endonuclease domain-containing protein [Alphaproteobacteria bacterium]
MLQGSEALTAKARKMRTSMTLPEVLLWRELRKRPGGLKFRRQHPAGPFVLDFYCHEARLIIEVDGAAHDMGDRPQRDERRDAYFAQAGLRVIRLSAIDILRDVGGAVARIMKVAGSSTRTGEET